MIVLMVIVNQARELLISMKVILPSSRLIWLKHSPSIQSISMIQIVFFCRVGFTI